MALTCGCCHNCEKNKVIKSNIEKNHEFLLELREYLQASMKAESQYIADYLQAAVAMIDKEVTK